MKKIALFLLSLCFTLSAAAQFERGTKYVNASLSGLGLSYSSNEQWNFGVEARAGYFAADCLMLTANVGYDHRRNLDDVSIGVGARYYFDQCGIYMGAGAEYNHFTKSNNDLMIPVEVGYAFYLNRYITFEPALYYKMSIHDFAGNSTVGVKLGLGFYF